MSAHSFRDYGLLAALTVLWGSAFSLIKISVDEIPPFTMTAVRVALAAACLYVVVRLVGQRLPTLTTMAGRRTWLHFLAVGTLGNSLPFTLIAWGEIEISSSLAAILIGVMPIFTASLARLTGIEHHIGWQRMAGIGLGLAALVVLMGPAALGGLGGSHLLAQLAVAAGAVSYAANAVYTKHLSFSVPILTLAAGNLIAACLTMVPLALIVDAPLGLRPGAQSVIAVVALGILQTALASVIYFRLLVSAGPTFASMINYLIPAFGTLVGVLWLNEVLGWKEVTALTLILAAIALVRRSQGRPAPAD